MTPATHRGPGRSRRIGHNIIKPGSGLAELTDRLAGASWDMVELDVLSLGSELVIAHDASDLEHPVPIPFERALEALCEHLPATVELNVDVKSTGYERQVVDVLRSLQLIERTLISTMELESLPVLRAAAPELRIGWSVPKARHNYLAHPLTRPAAYVMLAYLRRVLPRQTTRVLESGVADAIMAHWGVVTPTLWAGIQSLGKELYVWTVDDPDRLVTLDTLGVTGVITNDRTLFERAGFDSAGRRG
jgi:glycerophosphoryl diester phosphodiesterase